MKDVTSVSAGKPPVNEGSLAIDLTVPCVGLSLECGQIRDAPPAQALASEQADFEFRLIEPTAMLGSVVDSEAIPDSGSELRTEVIGERFPAMNVEIVDNHVDGARERIPAGSVPFP